MDASYTMLVNYLGVEVEVEVEVENGLWGLVDLGIGIGGPRIHEFYFLSLRSMGGCECHYCFLRGASNGARIHKLLLELWEPVVSIQILVSALHFLKFTRTPLRVTFDEFGLSKQLRV
ncbi:hypothetical protein K8089_10940 [Aequorivita sp. F47161]|uniref:Uncharacterized protein n=1 Tax=Aequorivita vitellina TaxID=2874475 RepID=A0A9X1U248_9FLAO|nr:hypothetical protein [Aequorivita vitellina]MCG2419540.1 hypothetical protein [Aequorivita vitellina]